MVRLNLGTGAAAAPRVLQLLLNTSTLYIRLKHFATLAGERTEAALLFSAFWTMQVVTLWLAATFTQLLLAIGRRQNVGSEWEDPVVRLCILYVLVSPSERFSRFNLASNLSRKLKKRLKTMLEILQQPLIPTVRQKTTRSPTGGFALLLQSPMRQCSPRCDVSGILRCCNSTITLAFCTSSRGCISAC